MNKQKTLIGCFFIWILAFIFLGSFGVKNASAASSNVDVWWPTNGVTVSGVQPFKGMLSGVSLDKYKMYWQVDNGGLVEMNNNYTDYPHKEASADVSGWNWNTNGTYTISLVANNLDGSLAGKSDVLIHVLRPTTSGSGTKVNPEKPVVQVSSNTGLLAGSTLYVDPYSPAANSVSSLRVLHRDNDANLMNKIASSPTSKWFGSWNSNISNDVNKYVSQANSSGALPVLVAYNIPGRDCGSYSAGGANSSDSYKSWIRSFAEGIGSRKAVVILEPDALPQMDCLSGSNQNDRFDLLKYAVSTLKSKSNVVVYIDAGHPGWKSVTEIVDRLKKAGIEQADGFSLNVSNFISLDENKSYGKQISKLLNNKHFVIDTSRNGSGSNGEWCNPSGRSLGIKPTTNTGDSVIDAYLWIKQPGESDGSCNGGPNAGVFWEWYALDLAKRASW